MRRRASGLGAAARPIVSKLDSYGLRPESTASRASLAPTAFGQNQKPETETETETEPNPNPNPTLTPTQPQPQPRKAEELTGFISLR